MTELNNLIYQIKERGLDQNSDRPVDPDWVREQCPNDWNLIEMDLHIMTEEDIIKDVEQNLPKRINTQELLRESSPIWNDIEQVRTIHRIIEDSHYLQAHYYFDDEYQIDMQHNSYITYPRFIQRSHDYQDDIQKTDRFLYKK